MASLADLGRRIGIPESELAELIELPVVAEAMQIAAESPNWAPRGIWRSVGRPTVFKESSGLDLFALRAELTKRRELATRGDGKIVTERFGHPVLMGRLQRAEEVARRRFDVIRRAERLLAQHYAEPLAMAEVKRLLAEEIKRSEGSDL